MLHCQKEQFQLPEEVSYLNCAYMSPLMKKVSAVGQNAVHRKAIPYTITPDDFFVDVDAVRQHFAQLIHAEDWNRIAVQPSVSYGLANVQVNVSKPKGKSKMVLPAEQFPSNYYPWSRLAQEQELEIQSIAAPQNSERRAAAWNESILNAIDETTLLVAIGHVHWADGTRFDLEAIGQRCRQYDALLIIDGTQSVGAMPFDVRRIQPDALICAGYKWLFGPYGIALSYYGERFDDGLPIEDNWINRLHSEDFTGLVNYQAAYRAKAARYSVGQQSNIISVPMLLSALEQLLQWRVDNIQAYCQQLVASPIDRLRAMGCRIEVAAWRGAHLFGVQLAPEIDLEALKVRLRAQQIYVSFRGNSMRVAPHVYNDAKDFDRLIACIQG